MICGIRNWRGSSSVGRKLDLPKLVSLDGEVDGGTNNMYHITVSVRRRAGLQTPKSVEVPSTRYKR